MKRVTFNHLARRELDEAFEYYEGARLGLGLEFLDVVEHAVSFLGRYPEAAAKVGSVTRRFVLPRFPYSLIYELTASGQVRILAVAHPIPGSPHHQLAVEDQRRAGGGRGGVEECEL
jgi:plasmid stabilization system protein ParE